MHLAVFVVVLVLSVAVLISGAVVLGTHPAIQDKSDPRYAFVETRRRLAIALVMIGTAAAVGVSVYYSTVRVFQDYRKEDRVGLNSIVEQDIAETSGNKSANEAGTGAKPSLGDYDSFGEDNYYIDDDYQASIYLLQKPRGEVLNTGGPASIKIVGDNVPKPPVLRRSGSGSSSRTSSSDEEVGDFTKIGQEPSSAQSHLGRSANPIPTGSLSTAMRQLLPKWPKWLSRK